MFDAEDVFFIFVIASFALAFLFIGTQLYFAYFRMNEILSSLSNSRGIQSRRSVMGTDPFTRFFILISVGGMLTFYKRSLKGGDLDAEDYKNFPGPLRRMITLSYVAALFGGTLLFVLWGIGKHMGWLK
ncbi:hypothetical protein SAMN05660489_00207 [Pseudomonas sp. LAMO17WK12:I10]|jgi:hypothetical protein|uniref:hypothetical protein n=1 Tax=Pseudomonas TaxID=286 RepID=UPI000BCE90CE|nr:MULTISPECIES: hypothetical protein [unclassified Pseudomonas]PXX76544.1 hypothetical protein H160_00314 [Pseudomonas sp. LAMO17WK12:I9]SNY04479.1 hypothetical protein SAMN05660489_00207 [Pseudomonas sp. LAMO17WK12:I10]